MCFSIAESISLERVKDVIAKHGQGNWSTFGSKLWGSNSYESFSHSIPSYDGKLRRIIEKVIARDGWESAMKSLWRACEEVEVLGAVTDELAVDSGE